ncbi:MAG: hypothetical protein Q9N26_05315 [Aquificota bacterium]|nr:hypothetical protein [Aquificota bacterium]MDQ7083171.1 hypothetical protein [Aquificota bacterium]
MRGVLTVLITALAVWAGDETYSNRYFLIDRIFLMPFVLKYSEDLGIDEDQMKMIKEFIRENEKEVMRNIRILEYLDRKAKLMILNGEDEDKLKEVLSDIAYVKTELTLLNARSVRFLRSVLTPDQFEKLKDLVALKIFEYQQ